MKRTWLFAARILAAVAVLSLSAPLAGAQVLASAYQAFSSILNPDANSGETTFRSLLVPMGGLAEGMGTAYTAVAKDSSYFESNPAASSCLDYTELAIFHNNWIADSKIEGAVYTIRYKGLGFGIAGKWLYLPFTAYDDFGDRSGSGYYSEAMAGFNVSYNLFPGYYFNGIAVGATGKIVYRSIPSVDDESITATNNAMGVMLDSGLLTRFNFVKLYHSRAKNTSIGLALKNLGPPVLGDPLPTVATFGAAYSPLRPLTISLDVSKPINLVSPDESEGLYGAVGALMQVTDFFQFQGGLLVKGGNPRISVGSSFTIESIRLNVNYTLDLTTQLTPLNRISIQAAFSLGDLGRAELAKKVDNLYLSGLEAEARGDIDAAIADWTEALKLDPTFDPARESLKTAQGTVELQQTMESLQRLEP
jgi:opacity protein-like surface antigen